MNQVPLVLPCTRAQKTPLLGLGRVDHKPFTRCLLDPPVVPFYPSLGEGSPTKIDYRKRTKTHRAPLFEHLSNLEDLVLDSHRHFFSRPKPKPSFSPGLPGLLGFREVPVLQSPGLAAQMVFQAVGFGGLRTLGFNAAHFFRRIWTWERPTEGEFFLLRVGFCSFLKGEGGGELFLINRLGLIEGLSPWLLNWGLSRDSSPPPIPN